MAIGAYMRSVPASLVGRGEPVRLEAARASAELFDVLSVHASLGRTFATDDAKPGASPTVMLSYGLWQQRFGGDAAILGQQLTINGNGYTVIGIMPVDFRLPSRAQLWLPLIIDPGDRISLWATNAFMIGRLRTDRTVGQAQEELRVLAPSFRELFPWKMPDEYGKSVRVVRLQDQIVGDVRPTLLVLLAAIVAVLLIVCMNVANLLLTRGLSRARELAIRAAVGATRGRLVRQLLVESLTVALLAGAVGTIGAFALLRLLLSVLPADVPRADEIGMDVRVLMFALVISALTGLF